MPILKSSKKRARQNIINRERNKPYKTKMLTVVKNIISLVDAGEVEKAEKSLPEAYSIIDVAQKKNLLHKNTASRKKSLIQRTVSEGKKGGKKKVEKVEKVEKVTAVIPDKGAKATAEPGSTKKEEVEKKEESLKVEKSEEAKA